MLLLVCVAPANAHTSYTRPQRGERIATRGRFTPDRIAAARASRRVFGQRWRTAACIAWWESRDELAARNGVNLGPWQVNLAAHPWAHGWWLRHSWLYSARIAYRISRHGTDWSAWSTHRLCGA